MRASRDRARRRAGGFRRRRRAAQPASRSATTGRPKRPRRRRRAEIRDGALRAARRLHGRRRDRGARRRCCSPSYGESGSDTGDLLLERAHKAIAAQDYDAAEQILDAAIAFMPDRAEAWNARATLRYLDDDYDGSMADIAQTLKREPRHLGALIGMASILKARDKKRRRSKSTSAC